MSNATTKMRRKILCKMNKKNYYYQSKEILLGQKLRKMRICVCVCVLNVTHKLGARQAQTKSMINLNEKCKLSMEYENLNTI